MPVTIRAAEHPAEVVKESDVRSAEKLLLCTSRDDRGESKVRIRGLVQTSFPRTPAEFESRGRLQASKNGFVNAVIDAYNSHHHLVVRPEDIWMSILTQLSIYVNANAERLRDQFVGQQQQRQEQLFIEIQQDMDKADHGEIAIMMSKLVGERVKGDMREYIMPTFTTTERTDQTVAAAIFLGTMQKYFTYSWGTRCGIPSVTLEGEASDWVDIYQRVQRMAEIFGNGVITFRNAVLAAVEGITRSFLDPEGEGPKVWQRVCVRHIPNGSGTLTYTGWITAFAYWSEDGRCLHTSGLGNVGSKPYQVHLRRGDIPTGFVTVPVLLKFWNQISPAEILAGSLAIKATDHDGEVKGPLDTVRPQLGWFLYKV